MKQISDVGVSFGYSNDNSQYSIHWNFDGARYHFWPNGSPGFAPPTTIFKNPPLGIKRDDPGHFACRRLDGTKPGNMVMIAQVMAIVNAGNMIEVARAARNAEQDKANRDNAENARLLELAKLTFTEISEQLHLDSAAFSLNAEQMRALIAYRADNE